MRIGPITLASPVVLAPMAGVTNVAFRTLCRELEQSKVGTVSGLYVCEMVTARALVERHPVTMHMTTFSPDESPRSLQLYTVDPATTYAAAKMIADEGLADHIDMNFGCPVPKVTKRGGGAALPFKRRLFGQIVAAAVRATEGTDIPVTVKFRIGIDDDHHTHLDAGRIAEAEGRRGGRAARPHGGAALLRHRRLGADRPAQAACADDSGARQRRHLRRQRRAGDDGQHRMRRRRDRPGLPGPALAVRRVVGRVHRQPATDPPILGEVADIVRRHGSCWPRTSAKTRACATSASTSAGTCTASRPDPSCGGRWRWSRRFDELDRLLDQLDGAVPFPDAATGPRGRQGSPARVALPDGWLTDPDDCTGAGAESRSHALGRLNRNTLEIASKPITQYDVGLACIARRGGGSVYPAARGLTRIETWRGPPVARELITLAPR